MLETIPFSTYFLILTDDCNLRCKYCYENNGRPKESYMSLDTAIKSVDFIIGNALKQRNKEIYLVLFGGEPLLNIDVMTVFFHYAVEKANNFDIRLNFSLVTNGTIYNRKYEEFVLNWYRALGGVSILISIDGTPEVHDKNRITKSGNPTSGIILENILKLKAFFKENKLDTSFISMQSVITKNNLCELLSSYKYFKELGVDSAFFVLQYEEDWDKNDIEKYIEQLTFISELVLEECVQENSLIPYNQAYIINDMKPGNDMFYTCSAGKSYFAILPNGDIYPCQRAYFSNQTFLKLGNVFDGIIDNDIRKIFFDTYRSDMHVDNNHCGKCENAECRICMLFNYEKYGDMLKCSPNNCLIYKARWKFIVKTKKKIYGFINKHNYNRCNELYFFDASYKKNT